jgi:hypothetical protein
MTSRVRTIAFAGALCALVGTAQAADGVLIVQKTTADGGAPRTTQVQIDARRMRAEAIGQRGEKQIVVFDGVKQIMMLYQKTSFMAGRGRGRN